MLYINVYITIVIIICVDCEYLIYVTYICDTNQNLFETKKMHRENAKSINEIMTTNHRKKKIRRSNPLKVAK